MTNAAKHLQLYLASNARHGPPMPVTEVDKEMTIGRAPENGLVFDDLRLSKYHARIGPDGRGYRVLDLGSLNGTWINGIRIGPGTSVLLNDGDTVSLGPVELTAYLRPSRQDLPAEAFADRGEAYGTHLELPADLAACLSETQQRVVSATATGDVSRYVEKYMAHPLAVIRRQNHLLLQWLDAPENPRAAKIPEDALSDLVRLNARVERLCHPAVDEEKDIGPDTYEEMHSAEFMAHGDLLPSHLSRLDDPETFSFRELLVSHKYKTALEELLIQGRGEGIRRHREIITGSAEAATVEIFRIYVDLYSPRQGREEDAGKMKTLGFYVLEGGSCRHRSAALQLMLQEAGIRSRYVRGVLMGSGSHAWVEVQEHPSRPFDLVLDPNFGVYGHMGQRRTIEEDGEPDLAVYGIAEGTALGETDPDDLVYMREQGRFNTIWRPKRRRFLMPAALKAEADVGAR